MTARLRRAALGVQCVMLGALILAAFAVMVFRAVQPLRCSEVCRDPTPVTFVLAALVFGPPLGIAARLAWRQLPSTRSELLWLALADAYIVPALVLLGATPYAFLFGLFPASASAALLAVLVITWILAAVDSRSPVRF